MEAKNEGIISIFSFLPEGCIAAIIALTSPRDACRASMVSRVFKSASESDSVWERFLPSDYQEIISKSVVPLPNYATKKDLFFNLCHFPILIDDGKLSFWISKLSGKKCYMICARELSIAWGDNPQYWGWTSMAESRFSEVAELEHVWWLEIKGKMQTQMLSLKTTYAAYLIYRVTRHSFDLDVVPKASVRLSDAISSSATVVSNAANGERTTQNLSEPEDSSVYLVHNVPRRRPNSSRWERQNYENRPGRVPQRRADGWMEILLGEFFNDEGEGEIEMKLLEIEGVLKRGLIVEGIELRPKE
ncbi:OLC1v1019326C1 [Oldenlandia corymbosa var. corymbosa]|uniref:OLC1v1019326C1 n=1 Tax=Oldenlandia corymbosa var. corymbosa TaxID=529605 RepID=A0AAV1EE46_OLDCO|nr:OLC1v1019326C1 [Oldenlandia corymbosa var. corymbosa]